MAKRTGKDVQTWRRKERTRDGETLSAKLCKNVVLWLNKNPGDRGHSLLKQKCKQKCGWKNTAIKAAVNELPSIKYEIV